MEIAVCLCVKFNQMKLEFEKNLTEKHSLQFTLRCNSDLKRTMFISLDKEKWTK